MTTDPSDIVERLLDVADLDARAGEPLGKACREAAAEITRLRAALADVKERYAKVTDEDREIARRWLSEGQINVDQMGRAAVLVAIRQEYHAALAEQDAEIERLRAALASVKEQEECWRTGVTSSNEAMMAISNAMQCGHDLTTYRTPDGGIGGRCKRCGETITIYQATF